MPEAKYKYGRHTPTTTTLDRDEYVRPGHKVGWRIRTNILRKGDVSYMAYCSCHKWRDDKWVAKRMIHKRFFLHIQEVDKQGALDVLL